MVPPIIPPLLSFCAGFLDSFTVLALFGLFVAQVISRSVPLGPGGLSQYISMAWR